MPTLGLDNFNIMCSTLGGFIALFGLISFLAKDRFYLSEACMFVCAALSKTSLPLLLHWAEQRKYVDQENFLVFALALALFVVGTDGLLGSDDVLACFVAGNAFTWDDWFRRKTEDDTLQPTIDMLLNVAVFVWFGAVCPWHVFVHNNVIPIYRLIPLGILVLVLRRPPIVALMHTRINQIEHWRQASIVGFFGPIGVSAIFYLYISLEYLRNIVDDNGNQREDAALLSELMTVVIWFLVICSIVVHGLTIPFVKLGTAIPRTLSEAVSIGRDPESAAQTPSRMERLRGDQSLGAQAHDGIRHPVAKPITPVFHLGRRIPGKTGTKEPPQPSDESTVRTSASTSS